MWLPDWVPQVSLQPITLLTAQAWHELLSPQTPDTFQARVLDLPMLLQELAEVAVLSSEDEREHVEWRAPSHWVSRRRNDRPRFSDDGQHVVK